MEHPDSNINEDGESLFHDLELRYISLRNEYDSLCTVKNNLEAKNSALEETLGDLRGASDCSNSEAARHHMELKQRDFKIRELEQTVEKLGDQYARKCEATDRLRDDVKMQADQLAACQGRVRELQTALSAAESQLLPAQYSLARLEREQASQAEHVSWLEAEQAAKAAQVVEARREITQLREESSAQLALAVSENTALAEQVVRLNDEAALREERLLELARRAQELEEQGGATREGLLAELQASRRLADLYKRYFDEATSRVSELEEASAMWQQRLAQQQQQAQSKLAAQVERADEVLRKSEEAARSRVVELEQELAAARGSVPLSSQQQSGGQGVTTGSRDLVLMHDSVSSPLFGLSAADMLDKVVRAEKLAAEETRQRRECELYLEKILKDIENKAPLIASQRRDYKRVLESHAQLAARVDALVSESGGLKSRLAAAESTKKEAVLEACSLESQNKDLARQLQHLLRKSMGLSAPSPPVAEKLSSSGTDAGGVISDYLVTFDSVEELQVRNMQLLKVVRKLSGDQEDALQHQKSSSSPHLVLVEEGERSGSVSADAFADMEEALKAAVAELADMRGSRHRMEEMVASLVQQRDIYRAMLEEVDASAGVGAGGSKALQLTSSPSSSTPSSQRRAAGDDRAAAAAAGVVEDLRREVREHKEAARSLQERYSRLEHAEAALNEAVDRGREELASLRSQLSTATSEAKFQSHRVGSLESALEASRGNEESLAKRRSEAEGLLMAQQKEARQQQEALLQMREALRLAEEKARRSEITAEVGRTAEARLQQQIKDLRDELGRQSALSESMGRIEASLASRMQQEREGLESEVQSLNQVLERNRKEFGETILIGEQKLQTLEDELRLCRAEKERRAAEAAVLREDLARQQGTCAAAQERSGVLERQLNLAQDRLASVQGSNTADSLLAAENEQKDVELERAFREISDLKMQLESSETHVVQFRTISNSTEAMLRELQQRSAENRQALEEELATAHKELEALRKELGERRDQLMEAMTESESSREALQATARQLEEDLRAARQLQVAAEQAARQAEAQAETLRGDTLRSQEAAKQATSNYERELAFHAKAAAELRASERRLEATLQDLEVSQHKTAELSAQCLEHELRRQEQEAAAAKALSSLQEDVAAHRHTNDLLHSQVQSMSVQLSRLASQSNSRDEECSLQQQDQQEGMEGVGAASKESSATVDEVGELRKSSFELREVIRYMKREKDMTEARMTLAETEKHRYSAQLSSVQKALDEARSELQRELAAKSHPTRSEEDFAKLMSEITQLNVVRESNAHLRFEHEQVSREKEALAVLLQAALAEAAPVRDRVCRLEAQLEALEAEKVALVADASYWKDRLHQLVSRYSDVDPEEHRVLQEKLAVAEQKLAAAEEQLADSQAKLASCNEQLEQAASELAAARVTSGLSEKTNANFRVKLREFSTNRKEMLQEIATLKSCLAEQTQKTAATEARLLVGQPATSQQAAGAVAPVPAATPNPAAGQGGSKKAGAAAQEVVALPQKSVVASKAAPSAVAPVPKGPGVTTTSADASGAITQQQQQQQQPAPGATAPGTIPGTTPNPALGKGGAAAKTKNLELMRKKLLLAKEAKEAKAAEEQLVIQQQQQQQAAALVAESHATFSALESGEPGSVPTTNAATPATAATAGVGEKQPVKRKSEETGTQEEEGGAEKKKRARVAGECTFFHSPAGCRFGDNCRFTHTISSTPAAACASVSDKNASGEAAVQDEDKAEERMEVEQEVEMEQVGQTGVGGDVTVEDEGEVKKLASSGSDQSSSGVATERECVGAAEQTAGTPSEQSPDLLAPQANSSAALNPFAHEFTSGHQDHEEQLKLQDTLENPEEERDEDGGEVQEQQSEEKQSGAASLAPASAPGLRPWPVTQPLKQAPQSSPFVTKAPPGTSFFGGALKSAAAAAAAPAALGFSFAAKAGIGASLAKSPSAPQLFKPPASPSSSSSSAAPAAFSPSVLAQPTLFAATISSSRGELSQQSGEGQQEEEDVMDSSKQTLAMGDTKAAQLTLEERRQARAQRFTLNNPAEQFPVSSNKRSLSTAQEDASEQSEQPDQDQRVGKLSKSPSSEDVTQEDVNQNDEDDELNEDEIGQ